MRERTGMKEVSDKEMSEWRGMFEESDIERFNRINSEVMAEIKELKAALTEFDAYRGVWAEIVANDQKPGRRSEFVARLKIMQGKALSNIDGSAWRLRMRIRGQDDSLEKKGAK